MFLFSRWCKRSARPRKSKSLRQQNRFRPQVLQLEDRLAPAVIAVTTTADEINPNDGQTSLREAIAQANTMGGSVTIELQASTYAIGPANLSFQINPTLGLNLTIQGAGPGSTVILGNSLDRVFSVTGNTPGVSVSFNDLTIKGGQTTGNGGGVDLSDTAQAANHDALIFNDAIVAGNTATGNGGGVWADEGSITLSGSIVRNNNANGNGGGIGAAGGNISLTGSAVDGNNALNGGGIFLSSSATPTLTVQGSSHVDGNTATSSGGGIEDSATGGSLLIGTGAASDVDSVSGNTSSSFGGGIFTTATVLTISNSDINNNSATGAAGGGIKFQGIGASTALTISGSIVSGNRANGTGGGLFNFGAVTETITGSAFNNDAATSGGGGIWDQNSVETSFTLTNSDVSGNRANGGSGGGLAINTSTAANTIHLTNDTIQNNYASEHGGGFENSASTGSSLTLDTVTVYGNFAAGIAGAGGGGVNTNVGTVSILNSVIENNTENAAQGGALNDQAGGTTSTLMISGSILSGNIAKGNGGGVSTNVVTVTITGSDFNNDAAQGAGNSGGGFEWSGTTLTATNVQFEGDQAALDGGGLYAANVTGKLSLTNATVVNDTAAFNGGGINVFGSGSLLIDHSTVSGNVALGQGGGLFDSATSGTVQYSTLANDRGEGGGGGLALASAGAALNVEFDVLYGDRAGALGGTTGDGGGILDTATGTGNLLEVVNSTIASNIADANGGGVAIEGATSAADILFATIDSNSAATMGGGIYHPATSTGTVALGDSIVADDSASSAANGPDLFGAFADKVIGATTVGNNIIGTAGTGEGYTGLTTSNGDQLGVNPLLNPLADNGGPTLTQSLQPGSPAVDEAAYPAAVQNFTDSNGNKVATTDQRGVTRPDGGTAGDNPDAGAFESNLG